VDAQVRRGGMESVKCLRKTLVEHYGVFVWFSAMERLSVSKGGEPG